MLRKPNNQLIENRDNCDIYGEPRLADLAPEPSEPAAEEPLDPDDMTTSDLKLKHDTTLEELLHTSTSSELLPDLGGPSTHFKAGPPKVQKTGRSASRKYNDSSVSSDESLGSSTATKVLVDDSSGDELSMGIEDLDYDEYCPDD